MLEESEIKITKLEDKNLNEIMEKLQSGQETTAEEKEKLWKALIKNNA
ncbi:hypothetical protein LCGC14_0687940 [marine sediment metagenome]|uniref:Uncharacterized protein n=1 Tax=marine sediment metagenome TaxID=412755 RepID=A0A0F9TUC9_9ZZZZ